LIRQKQEIDGLFNQVQGFPGDPYIKALLTYYLCIRVSGFLENCVRIIFTEYSIPRTSDHVSTYVTGKLKEFPNPTYANICKLAGDFHSQWRENFKSRVTAQIRESLESIRVNRNAIAHGSNSPITVAQLATYYQDAVHLIERLEEACV
jgi:hypothetical protein